MAQFPYSSSPSLIDFFYCLLNPNNSASPPPNLTAIAISYGPPSNKAKLTLHYPYGFEIGCGDPTGKAVTEWIEGTAKSISGSNVNVEFPMCTGSLKPLSVRYCWRDDPCKPFLCPIYSGFSIPSPPFTMDLLK